MADQLLDGIAPLDILTIVAGSYEWIKFTLEINLSYFEKIHSGGSSDSYILRSITVPKLHM